MSRLKSKRDPAYLAWFALENHRCFVCGTIEAVQGHHVKLYSSDPKDDHKLLPLCIEHHTGLKLSPHGTPRLWRETYSMEHQEQVAGEIYAEYMLTGEWL